MNYLRIARHAFLAFSLSLPCAIVTVSQTYAMSQIDGDLATLIHSFARKPMDENNMANIRIVLNRIQASTGDFAYSNQYIYAMASHINSNASQYFQKYTAACSIFLRYLQEVDALISTREKRQDHRKQLPELKAAIKKFEIVVTELKRQHNRQEAFQTMRNRVVADLHVLQTNIAEAGKHVNDFPGLEETTALRDLLIQYHEKLNSSYDAEPLFTSTEKDEYLSQVSRNPSFYMSDDDAVMDRFQSVFVTLLDDLLVTIQTYIMSEELSEERLNAMRIDVEAQLDIFIKKYEKAMAKLDTVGAKDRFFEKISQVAAEKSLALSKWNKDFSAFFTYLNQEKIQNVQRILLLSIKDDVLIKNSEQTKNKTSCCSVKMVAASIVTFLGLVGAAFMIK